MTRSAPRSRRYGTFPSAAGFRTAELFFTDDSGVYVFPTRDAGALVDPAADRVTPELVVERHRGRIWKLAGGRLYLPAAEPYLEGHNTWCVNVPGSLLVIPVADIAQHLIAILCFAQNGYAIYNDVNGRKITGLCGAGMAGCRRAEPHRPVSRPAPCPVRPVSRPARAASA